MSGSDRDPVVGEGYTTGRVLVRLHDSPVGVLTLPVVHGHLAADAIRRATLEQLTPAVLRHLVGDALAFGIDDPAQIVAELPHLPHPPDPWPLPSVTVAVCTRDRPVDLRRCLASLNQLDPVADEIIVIDNGSKGDETARVVAAHPRIRYVSEPSPGLDRARSRAVAEARSTIVAFTDDDVVVDRRWVGALQRVFAEPEVAAVTGLVLPSELETEPQLLFERYGGFARGFERQWYRIDTEAGERAASTYGGAGRFGTGANMAFRRAVFGEIGMFDPSLDVGTPTNGGGDLDMFFRVLAAGKVLVYEPDAIVWHRHRHTYAELRQQIRNNGIGFYSYLVRNAIHAPHERSAFARLGAWWLWHWNIRRLVKSIYKPGEFPRDLIVAELSGSVRGLFRYQRSRRAAAADVAASKKQAGGRASPQRAAKDCESEVDIAFPVQAIDSVGYGNTSITVRRSGEILGAVGVSNAGTRISESRLRDAIARTLGAAVFRTDRRGKADRLDLGKDVEIVRRAIAAERRHPSLGLDVDVSIVLATRNRPAALKRALASLLQVKTRRRVEIVVVDNDPGSGATAAVVADFSGVRLVPENRAGLSYARNAGIAASTGAIVVATDDDVIVPEDWLERLLAPFADPDVMAVTGNVLPWELSSRVQQLFETYGGLGRGADSFVADSQWFWSFRRAVPTWLLGGTANAAFRAAIFADPAIGMFDEALGAGTPAGCSEDTDLFYRILLAGYRIAYRGDAFVWHRHRANMRDLRRQLYAYAKGHVAYQLTTFARDRDHRALARILLELPDVYLRRIVQRLSRRGDYPVALIAIEVLGSLAGPFAWWRSRRRARRLGPGARYIASGSGTGQPDPPPPERVMA